MMLRKMPSDSKKKRDQKKKEAAKKRDVKKPLTKETENGDAGSVENDDTGNWMYNSELCVGFGVAILTMIIGFV